MKNSQPLRHPSLVLQQIRSEYQARQKITTQAAQKHLSNTCGWSESTWGNLERSTAHSGQAWDPEYTWDMVKAGIIKDGGRYYEELVAWERAEDTAAHIAAREEYRWQQEEEQQVAASPSESTSEAVKAVTEDKTADNEGDNGRTAGITADNEEEGKDPMAPTASGASGGNRRWYWIAGIGGCLLLLSLCIVTVAASYFFWGQTQLARRTPDSPAIIEIEKQVTRIVEVTRVVEATVVVEKTQTVEVTRQAEIATITETPAPQKDFFDCLKPQHLHEMIDNTRTIRELIDAMDEEYYASRGGEWKGERVTIPARSVFWCDLRTSDLPAGVKAIRAQGGWGVFLTDEEVIIPSPNQGGRWQRLCP
jgi:hypothetical protein